MDGARFDHLTRAFGARGTRRSALGLLTSSSLGALLLGLHRDHAAAACSKVDAACKKDNDCCSNVCGQSKQGDRTCRKKDCKRKNVICTTNADCCDGDCRLPSTGGRKRLCVPSTCKNTGQLCGLDNDGKPCCEGHCQCFNGNCICRKYPCHKLGWPCQSTAECCHGPCAGGSVDGKICRNANCNNQNEGCDTDTECCKGHCNLSFMVCSDAPAPPRS